MRRRTRIVLRKWMRRILRIHDTPHSIALGVSIGTFIGWGPLYGLHTVLALAVAAVARCNKAASLLACWINNPVTMWPIFYLQYILGSLLLSGHTSKGGRRAVEQLIAALGQVELLDFVASMRHVAQQTWGVFQPWLVGSLISSTVLAALSYPLAKRAVLRHRHRTEERRARRHRRIQALREEQGPDDSGTTDGSPKST